MKKLYLYISLSALLLGFSFGWVARGFCHFPRGIRDFGFLRSICVASAPEHPKGPPGVDRIVEGINLSEEQKEQIRALDETHRSKLEALRKELDLKRRTFEAAMDQGSDVQTLRPKFDDLFEAKQAMEIEHLTLMISIRDLLSESQRAELKERRLPRGPGGPPPGGGMGGPGGPRGF